MPAVGGSIEAVSLDGREFPVAADADSNRDLGGFNNEVQPNGNGSARLIKTRVPTGFDGLSLEIDDDQGDLEALQALADRTDFFPIVVTYVSGISYQCTGQIIGEIKASSQTTTSPIALMGPFKATKQ